MASPPQTATAVICPARGSSRWRERSTAIGKAILAGLGDEEIAAICARTGMPRMTAHTLTEVAGLLPRLREVRRRGYAVDDEENEPGLRCVGAAVTGHNGQVVGAVSVSTLVHELPLREMRSIGAEVVKTAREVSDALGAP